MQKSGMDASSIGLKDLKKILKNIPLFSHLSAEKIAFIAKSVEKVECPADAILIKEGDLSGDVYFVITGHLDVTKQDPENHNTHLGSLTEGDSIGLSEEGFYSQTGLRTATVKAISPSILFCWKIDKILEFLQKFPDLYLNKEMHIAADRMLRAKFLKEAMLFSSLSAAAINALSRDIKEIHIEANTIILQEGEVGDKCYLVRSGQLVVSAKRDDGDERVISTLNPPMLFGETSLLTESPRNATVKSVTACDLLVLEHDQFIKVLEQEPKIINELSSILIERSRPKKNPQVSVYYQQAADGEKLAVLKNKTTASYYRLSRVGLHVWQMLDGKTALQEIITSVFEEFFIFSPESITRLVADLQAGDFVLIQSAKNLKVETDEVELSWFKRFALRITKIMECEYSFKAVDATVTAIFYRGGWLLFTHLAQIIFIGIIITGGIAFFYMTPMALMAVKQVEWLPIIIGLSALNFITVFTHEMSHALATKYYGFQVHRFGIGWYWVGGIAFTDTSDMWLSTRWPRTVVNIAGLYSDLLWAGLAGLAVLFVTSPSLLLLLWLFALSSYITVFKNLDPTLEFDGYYVLMDLMDKANLREGAVMWLINVFSKKRQKHIFKGHTKEILYWTFCAIFLVISVEVTIFLQKHVVAILFPSVSHSIWYNYFLYWGIPILVIIFASLGIWAEMAKQKEMKKVSFGR